MPGTVTRRDTYTGAGSISGVIPTQEGIGFFPRLVVFTNQWRTPPVDIREPATISVG
jgi:hypothetical protein